MLRCEDSALSDVSAPLSGNLCVFPGSHHTLHPRMRSGGRLAGIDAPDGPETPESGGGSAACQSSRADTALRSPNQRW